MREIANAPRPIDLTPRESMVLKALLEGDTAKLTAARLGISPKTVESYRSRLRMKLAASNTVELVRIALERGLES